MNIGLNSTSTMPIVNKKDSLPKNYDVESFNSTKMNLDSVKEGVSKGLASHLDKTSSEDYLAIKGTVESAAS